MGIQKRGPTHVATSAFLPACPPAAMCQKIDTRQLT